MSAPRVLLVTSDYPPKLGGVASYYYGLFRALPNVYVLTNVPGASGTNIHRVGWTWAAWPRWFPLLWVVPWWKTKTQSCMLAAGEFLPTGVALCLMRLAFGWPYLVFLHGLDVRLSQRTAWKRFLTRRILALAACVVTNSEFTQDKALAAGAPAERTLVVYPGTDLIVAPPAAGQNLRERHGLVNKQVVLTVSRLVHRKGVSNVIQAVRRLHATMSDVVYVVAGDGPERDSLVAEAQGLPVLFLGNVSDAERNAWYMACDVFVLTPVPDDTDVEGFGIVYLEAMTAGKPIVATRTGGVPEAVGEAGVLLDNLDELDKVLERLLADKAEQKRLGEIGKERVKQFTWPNQTAQLAQRIKELVRP
jgi:phosphatidyl-myo-inositol dimannoside synthase